MFERLLLSTNLWGYFPLIFKLSRFSKNTESVIDNILTNDVHVNLNGLLTDEIADHLPATAVKFIQSKNTSTRCFNLPTTKRTTGYVFSQTIKKVAIS